MTSVRNPTDDRSADPTGDGRLTDSTADGAEKGVVSDSRLGSILLSQSSVSLAGLVVFAGIVLHLIGYALDIVVTVGPFSNALIMATLPAAVAIGLFVVGRTFPPISRDSDAYRTIAIWIGVGLIAHVVISFWFTFIESVVSFRLSLGYPFLVTIGFGATAGAIVGVYHLRKRATERELDEERARREYVNRVMRTLLDENIQTILSSVESHREYCPEKDPLEGVELRSAGVLSLISKAEMVLKPLASDGGQQLEIQDLSTILSAEIERARSSYDVTIDADVPESVPVATGESIDLVFESLLTNAVKHNDADDPRIAVDVTVGDETAVVRVADNGPGVPDDQTDEIFELDAKGEESGGTGFGLYLVDVLVSRYGGSVRVEDNEPRGAVFVVEIDRVRT